MEMNSQGRILISDAAKIKESFKNNNIDEVKSNLATLKKDYQKFSNASSKIYWLQFVPIVSGYVSDLRNGVTAGREMLDASEIAIEAIEPYADLIGFKKGATFAEKSADDRIQTAVLTLDKVLTRVDDITIHVEKAKVAVDKINPNRYPEKFGKKEVRSKMVSYINQFDVISSLFINAKPLIVRLPKLLGVDGEKSYLVLFQNDAELRPTGGFLTAYAIFKVNQGKIQALRSKDIYELDDTIKSHPKAPDKILVYHKDVKQFFIRDSNLSPDFYESIKLFNTLYDQSSQKIDYDGIIAVDTQVLVDTLQILGDTEVRGTVFSAKNDPKYNIPQVIYRLLDEIDRPVGFIKEDRKGILGDLLYVLMQKALGFSPSQYWGPLSQEMIRNMTEKHILVYLKDQEAQKALEAINFAGRIVDAKVDYLHINDTNFAGAKSNLFVSHAITSNTVFNGNGPVQRQLTIEYKNPYKHSDCSLERGGLCINASLRNWLRIYVPKGSKLISFQGSEKSVKTYEDLGKTVFEGFLNIKPEGKAVVKIVYELQADSVNKNDYKLLIQKQPGTKGHQYEIKIDGKLRDKFNLTQDREYVLK